jgi:hypothetical protein
MKKLLFFIALALLLLLSSAGQVEQSVSDREKDRYTLSYLGMNGK